jgi:hypothetical protein|tara:strand:+ start:440 stop:817 length:378 start_codon:yes stop_codon:yes gene_type:complete
MIVVDLRKENILLQEAGILSALGSWTKSILKHMYGKDTKMVGNVSLSDLSKMLTEDDEPNFIIRGKYRDVKAYASAIVREKEYLDAYSEYGKDHPQTAKARANLRPAVAEFESATGLKWPFVDEE